MLEVRGLTKRFPAVNALQDVNLAFRSGEVHGVVGENGAGKSTLMNLLCGVLAPTSGEILIDGSPVVMRSPAEAIARGVVMIHQELNLIDDLTVAENIFLGREKRRGIVLDRAAMREEAAKYLAQVAAPFSPDTPLRDLSVAGKQLVEIAKAVSYDAKVIVMDEPTAVLSQRETTALFALIRALREKGTTVLFVSHYLNEVVGHCDRVTVMRDGRWVQTVQASETSPAQLAALMVGRELDDVYPEKQIATESPIVFEVSNLKSLPVVKRFDLQMRAGEIVGMAGLVGSGRTEIAEAIVGIRPRTVDALRREGTSIAVRNPGDALQNGIAYVSEDRKGAGLVLSMSTAQNVTLSNLSAYGRLTLDRKREAGAVKSWVERLGIRVGDVEEPVGNLSGGNQQKVAVAKWLDAKPKVLILDEPTRGIDVGAKREMYALIRDLAAEGMACLVISSEMMELIGLCHRILVIREGALAGELREEEMTEEAIMRLAAGVEVAA